MYNILITGGFGYIGQVFINLLDKNYKITVIDSLNYNQDVNKIIQKYPKIKFIKGDVRDEKLIKSSTKNIDFIFPLAGLVGAPLCKNKPEEAKEVNEDSIKLLCKIADKDTKIIIPTTNSGYGIGSKNSFCTETSPINPISIYGITKMAAEKLLLKRGNAISLRLATVFGMSPRMRLDLLVNNFCHIALTQKKIEIFEGHFRRNFVHIKDVARAFIFCVENFEKLKNNVYNFGLEEANLTKLELANQIKKYVPEFQITENQFEKDPDQRDYIVSNQKIINTGFKFENSLDQGIKELINEIPKLKNKNFSNV